MRVCLIAIAKDEGRFLPEWLAHYIALGIDRIVVYDNDSSDGTADVLAAAATLHPVTRVPWPSRPKRSPQITAYNHGLEVFATTYEWVCFFDCDEFLVLRQDSDMGAFLRRFPSEVGAVGINWLGFGSSGRTESDYDLVTEVFRRGARRRAGNNSHIKTIARPDAVERVGIHDCVLKRGSYVHPDLSPLAMSKKRGVSDRIDHSVAQLNHYQVKSRADFDAKMRRGRAGKAAGDPSRIRSDPQRFFEALDHNGVRYDEIDRGREGRLAVLAEIRDALAGSLAAPSRRLG